MDLVEAIRARRSVRGFLDKSVPKDVLSRIFGEAQRAASWCNIQPWRVWLVSGDVRVRVVDAMVRAASSESPQSDFPWPKGYPEPYLAHRRECGKALYSAMGVARDDGAARADAWMQNFRAFGAPHIAFVGLDKRFDMYGALDIGCWLGEVMLLAEAEGVSTCAQAALAMYPAAIRSVVEIPEEVGILFGIAMGYEDPSVKANACRTTRSALEDNLKFVG